MSRSSTAHLHLCACVIYKISTRHPLSTHTSLHRSTVTIYGLGVTGLNTFIKRNNVATVFRFLKFSRHKSDHKNELKVSRTRINCPFMNLLGVVYFLNVFIWCSRYHDLNQSLIWYCTVLEYSSLFRPPQTSLENI
jgi:hypothetical protein